MFVLFLIMSLIDCWHLSISERNDLQVLYFINLPWPSYPDACTLQYLLPVSPHRDHEGSIELSKILCALGHMAVYCTEQFSLHHAVSSLGRHDRYPNSGLGSDTTCRLKAYFRTRITLLEALESSVRRESTRPHPGVESFIH